MSVFESLSMYCLLGDSAEEIYSCARYFSVQVPKRADSKGLTESHLGNALKTLGIDDVLDKVTVLGVRLAGNS